MKIPPRRSVANTTNIFCRAADARRIYQRGGLTLDDEVRHHSFGTDLVEQNWSRRL